MSKMTTDEIAAMNAAIAYLELVLYLTKPYTTPTAPEGQLDLTKLKTITAKNDVIRLSLSHGIPTPHIKCLAEALSGCSEGDTLVVVECRDNHTYTNRVFTARIVSIIKTGDYPYYTVSLADFKEVPPQAVSRANEAMASLIHHIRGAFSCSI